MIPAPNLVKLQAAIVEAHRFGGPRHRRDAVAAWRAVYALVETEVLPFYLIGQWRESGTIYTSGVEWFDHTTTYRRLGAGGRNVWRNTVLISQPYQELPVDDWIDELPLGFTGPNSTPRHVLRVRKLPGVSWWFPRLVSQPGLGATTAYLIADPSLWRGAADAREEVA